MVPGTKIELAKNFSGHNVTPVSSLIDEPETLRVTTLGVATCTSLGKTGELSMQLILLHTTHGSLLYNQKSHCVARLHENLSDCTAEDKPHHATQ